MAFAYCIAILVSLGFAYLWYSLTPDKGSGWCMFAAVVIAVGTGSPTNPVGNLIAMLFATVSFGAFWYFNRGKEYSGWLLFVAIVSGIGMLAGFVQSV